MTTYVLAERNGRITTPAKTRKKFKIEQDTTLVMVEAEDRMIFKPKL